MKGEGGPPGEDEGTDSKINNKNFMEKFNQEQFKPEPMSKEDIEKQMESIKHGIEGMSKGADPEAFEPDEKSDTPSVEITGIDNTEKDTKRIQEIRERFRNVELREKEAAQIKNDVLPEKEGQQDISRGEGFLWLDEAKKLIKEGDLESGSKAFEIAARELEGHRHAEAAKEAWQGFAEARYQLKDKHGALVGLRNAGHRRAIKAWRIKVFLENLFK